MFSGSVFPSRALFSTTSPPRHRRQHRQGAALGRQSRRQLLLDGRMGSVAFVANATDDLDALHVAAELGIKGVATYGGISEAAVSGKLRAHVPFVRRLRKRVTSVAEMQMRLTQRLRRDTSSLKRKTDALAAGGGDTFRLRTGISRVKARILQLNSDLKTIRQVTDKAIVELGQREHILNHLCATARNAFCRTQWRMRFAQGMRELMAASVMSSGSTGQDATAEPPVLPSPSAPWRRRRCPPSASTCDTRCSCREPPPRRRGRMRSSCCPRRRRSTRHWRTVRGRGNRLPYVIFPGLYDRVLSKCSAAHICLDRGTCSPFQR